MQTVIKKSVLFSLFLISVCTVRAQKLSEDLNIKPGTWGYNCYIDSKQVSLDDFVAKLNSINAEVGSMFKTGKKLNMAGTIISCVGACFVGYDLYDLSTRLCGGKGNTTFLIGSGGALAVGIILYYVGASKMKKALTMYKNNAVSFSISPAQTGIGLCFNF
ncbi:hypothetical protein AGMMS50262_23320 [Bacteroidia bacterium]|nr:hypothetical protein AGMMS50262_23320 [Bacteroidia bacterium]